MRSKLLVLVTSLSVGGCGGAPLFPLASTYPWKCVLRDSKGDLFLGIEPERQAAVDEAHRQCLGGSVYKLSCKAENSHCAQLPNPD